MIKAINEEKYDDILGELKHVKKDELQKLYQEREEEPVTAGEDWKPKDKKYL
jgi:hypothetical protein